MKKHLLIAGFSLAALVSTPAMANDKACAMVLCMAGEVMGKGGGSACSGPISDFFSIRKFSDGSFSPSKTSRARSSQLNKCPDADAGTKNSIINKFGRVF